MKPKLSIIIVTYNSSQHIKDMLLSIEKHTKTHHEIIVVDNNSQDRTIAQIYASKVSVTLLQQKENLGFSKANNLSVNNTKGEYLLFLNPDTKVLDYAIDNLYNFLKSRDDVGIVAPQLIEDNGNIQPSVRNFPTITRAIKEYYLGIKNSYEPFYPLSNQPLEVESVVGAAMMIAKNIYRKSGGFNNKYFMYYEDLEICRKIKEMGLKVVYLQSVKMKHSVGASASTNPKTLRYLKHSARLYHGAVGYYILQLLLRFRGLSLGKFFQSAASPPSGVSARPK